MDDRQTYRDIDRWMDGWMERREREEREKERERERQRQT